MKIFISYAHVDEAQVRELVEILRDDANHDVWFDPRLVAGKAWEDQLLDAIQASDCFLYALTPESTASKWCQWEFAQAVHANKPVVPVKMQANVTFSGVLDILNRVQYVDFCQGATRRAVAKLVSSVAEAECIAPEDVPLFSAPHGKPERLIESPDSGRALADDLYREALAGYKGKQYEQAYELLEDCLIVESDHADAQKLLILVKRKIEKPITPDPAPLEPQETKRQEVRPPADVLKQKIEKPVAPAATSPKPQETKRQGGEVMTTADLAWIPKAEKPRLLRVEDILPPPFEWIDIPAGEVILEDASNDYGTKGGQYYVEAFAIAKYPITNAQYQVFVDAKDGYRDPQWWNYSDEAKQWRAKNQQVGNTAFKGNDLPRTNVCWYEAIAFCQWLTQKTGQPIVLPTEQQWQRAAQGNDNRKYPWGNEKPNKYLCNFNRIVGKTTSVTQYSEGASPYGVMDMSGNVWEWCLTKRYALTRWYTDSIQMSGSADRVLRGGSWFDVYSAVRVVNRNWDDPGVGHGFRCALSAFQ